MSFEAVAWVRKNVIGDPMRKLILISVACHVDRDGTGAWASIGTYAEEAECSERTAQRHIATLLEMGWLREGDPSRVPSHVPPRYRPIVYDVALDLATVDLWRESRTAGRRDRAAVPGAAGGRAAAAKAAAKKAEEAAAKAVTTPTGDSVTPLRGDSVAPLVTGDNLAPLSGDNVTPLNAPIQPDPETVRGDTRGDGRGDTGVTQSLDPSSYGGSEVQTLAIDCVEARPKPDKRAKAAKAKPVEPVASVADIPEDPDLINASHVVAVWTDAYESNDVYPTTSQRAQVGRAGRELLAKNDPFKVLEAARVSGVKGYTTIDRELGALNGRTWTRPDARPATTDARVAQGQALKRGRQTSAQIAIGG